MSRRKNKFSIQTDDLNLVPIMNMVMCLIPVVLAGSAAVKVGVINVNAPKFGMGVATPNDSDEKPLNLTIAIGEDGFRITASGADINEVLGLAPAAALGPDGVPAAAAAGPMIPKKGDQYDFVELYNKMAQIKEKFPDESIVNLAADARIPFKHVVNTMDTMRLRLEGSNFADMEALRAAKPEYEGNTPKLLWPDVVFAVAQ